MYPTVLLLYPEIAKGLIDYRFERLDTAHKKALSYHPPYDGNMFPWESAYTGIETCPEWAATGQLEQHISGDVAFATNQYWEATKDISWLKSIGYPLLSGIATFWASKVQKRGTQYIITGVIPPDEYVENVNNSAYTNAIAALSLLYAVNAQNVLGLKQNTTWMDIAKNMYIPFDPIKGIHPEYDGYKGQTIKQADVVLLGYPLGWPMSADVRKNDVVYYANRTDFNGPAMTWAMHTISWLEISDNNLQEALDSFSKSRFNMKQPYYVWTENPSGGTVNFITGAGAFLQSTWAGFGGIRLSNQKLTINSHIPVLSVAKKYEPDFALQRMVFRGLWYLNYELDIELDKHQNIVIITVIDDSQSKVQLLTAVDQQTKEVKQLILNKPVIFDLSHTISIQQ